jgi:DDE superfamily endonuclease
MRDDSVDLWALDEVHFQQQGSRCRMWVPPETRDPIVYHHPTRKSVGYFAAVRLRDGEFLFRRETGRFNGESFWEFLKMFREASAVSGRRVLAISDNAQYHRSKLLTARNSTRSNGSGSSRAGCVCTIVTSDSSMQSFPPSKVNSPNRQSPTISCDDYAQSLKTLCLALMRQSLLPASKAE